MMTEAAAAQARHTRGIVLLMVVVLAWGTVWPINKALLAYVTPIWSIALRTYISALALFAISTFITGIVTPKRGDMPVLISMVLLHMVGFTILTTLALQVVPAGQTAVLAYTIVLWAPLGAALFLGERLSLRRAIGLGLGVLGLIVIFNPLALDWSDRSAVAGNVTLLGAAMLWAASIVHNRGHVWRSTPFQVLPWQMLLAAAILTPIALFIEGPPAMRLTGESLAMLLFAALPGSALAYWAAAVSSSELPASTTSIGLLCVPAISVVVAMILLGEQPTLSLLVALALILAGVGVGISGSATGPAGRAIR